MEKEQHSASPIDITVRGWLPIETVPRDGSAVLVFLEEELHHCRVVGATFQENVTIVGGLFHFEAPKATHWMSPPDTPNAGDKPPQVGLD